jgi:hypothetical protein
MTTSNNETFTTTFDDQMVDMIRSDLRMTINDCNNTIMTSTSPGMIRIARAQLDAANRAMSALEPAPHCNGY